MISDRFQFQCGIDIQFRTCCCNEKANTNLLKSKSGLSDSWFRNVKLGIDTYFSYWGVECTTFGTTARSIPFRVECVVRVTALSAVEISVVVFWFRHFVDSNNENLLDYSQIQWNCEIVELQFCFKRTKSIFFICMKWNQPSHTARSDARKIMWHDSSIVSTEGFKKYHSKHVLFFFKWYSNRTECNIIDHSVCRWIPKATVPIKMRYLFKIASL